MRPTFLVFSLCAACGVAEVSEPGDVHETKQDAVRVETIEPEPDITSLPDVEQDVEVTVEPGWQMALEPQLESFLGIWGSDPTDVWVVGAGGIVVNGGPSGWRQLDLRQVDGSGAAMRGVFGDGEGVWLVGDEGRAYRFNRIQGRADVIYTNTTMRLNAVWGVGSDVWAVGGPLSPEPGSPIILKLDPYAGIAQTLPEGLPTDAALTDVWGVSASNVWAVGDKGIILHWDGSVWSRVVVPDAPSFRGVFVLDGEVAAVGDPSTGAELFIRTANSDTFARVPLSDPAPLNAIALASDGSGWAVGAMGRMFARAPGASTWDARAPYDGYYWNDVWIDARGDVWVAGHGIARLGPARGDIASGPLVRVDDPIAEDGVVEPDEDVEVVETAEVVEWDTSTTNPKSFSIGTAVPTDPTQFTAWVDDQVVPIQHGPQGGFHLETYVRFPFDGSATELSTAIHLELWIDGVREGFLDTPSYPVPAQSPNLYQTYPMTLAWDCSLSFTCESSRFDGKTAVVTATVGPPGQSWSGSVRLGLDDTW